MTDCEEAVLSMQSSVAGTGDDGAVRHLAGTRSMAELRGGGEAAGEKHEVDGGIAWRTRSERREARGKELEATRPGGIRNRARERNRNCHGGGLGAAPRCAQGTVVRGETERGKERARTTQPLKTHFPVYRSSEQAEIHPPRVFRPQNASFKPIFSAAR